METLNALYQKMLALPYDDLLSVARTEFVKLVLNLTHFFGQNQKTTSQALLVIINAALGADGELTKDECRFFNNLMGSNHTKESVLETMSLFSYEESVETVKQLADSLDTEMRGSLLTLCLCFLAADKVITPKESELFHRLIQ